MYVQISAHISLSSSFKVVEGSGTERKYIDKITNTILCFAHSRNLWCQDDRPLALKVMHVYQYIRFLEPSSLNFWNYILSPSECSSPSIQLEILSGFLCGLYKAMLCQILVQTNVYLGFLIFLT